MKMSIVRSVVSFVAVLGVLLFVLFVSGNVFAQDAASKQNQKKETRNPHFNKEQAKDVNLPNVLIIGDSISLGYSPFVQDLLKGKANVFRPLNASGSNTLNCQSSKTGVEEIDKWLDTAQNGGKRWDVIHFNWGLWDVAKKLKETEDEPRGISPEQYEANLETLVVKLKKSGAKLIWGSTSKIPEGTGNRKTGDEKKYNEIAAKVMAKHGIVTDDIQKLTDSLPAELSAKLNDVHYKPEGYKKIAEQVAASIETALKK